MRLSRILLKSYISPWQKLGFEDGAVVTKSEVKKRFRELVKQHHPDIGGDETEFKELVAAFEKISSKTSERGTRIDDEEIAVKKNVFESFWTEQTEKIRKMSIPDKHRTIAYYYITVVRKVDMRDFMMQSSSVKISQLNRGMVLQSTFTYSPGLGLMKNEEDVFSDKPDPQKLTILLMELNDDQAWGIALNRPSGGPHPGEINIHGDAQCPGRVRLFNGVYTSGKPSNHILNTSGVTRWDNFELMREVNCGMWSIIKYPARNVIFENSQPKSASPLISPLSDIATDARLPEDTLSGLIHLGVVSTNPWR